MHKEAKGYLDAVRATTLSQTRIAETIDQFYDETSPLSKAGKMYKNAVTKMDEEARSELVREFDVGLDLPNNCARTAREIHCGIPRLP